MGGWSGRRLIWLIPFLMLPVYLNGQASAPTFLLYTRGNRQNAERLRFNNTADIRSSAHFNGNRTSKMIIFGFLDNPTIGRWMRTMVNQFLTFNDLNVFIVDWSNANQFPYGRAVANARQVGRMVASQIRALSSLRNSTPSQFHLLGHSLGAHVAGFAGKQLNGALGQITGLDPAGPSFENAKPQARLWRTDAQFVDVIHTDAGRLGMWQACGSVDIYPNGGQSQPGCTRERVGFLSRGFVDGARSLFACDHQRAVDYYSEAITAQGGNRVAKQCDNYNNFRAGRCSNCGPNGRRCVPLGPKARSYRTRRQSSGGRFFINTAASSPYFR